MNNARSKLKTWPIVLCCMNTGALHIELSHSYGSESFITCYDRFVSLRGTPSAVYSDRGSQLTKASDINTEENSVNWNWKAVKERSARQGTTWRFCPPGCHFKIKYGPYVFQWLVKSQF